MALPSLQRRRIRLALYTITAVYCALRGFQFLAALAALATVAAGFVNSEIDGKTFRLGSHEASLVLLASYSAVAHAAWYLACVELLPFIQRPGAAVSRVVDGVLAALSLCSGIALTASEYVQACDSYGLALRCGNLQASAAFAILTAVPLTGSIVFTTVVTPSMEQAISISTGVWATPTDQLRGQRQADSDYYHELQHCVPREAIVLSSSVESPMSARV
jgi:hypothetical protein